MGSGPENSHTLHTTRLHRRHSDTISLAQDPIFPIKFAAPSSTKYQSAALALYRSVCSLFGTTSSLVQRSVLVINCLRNCSKFSRVWRHVRERLSSVLRSINDAISQMILDADVST